MSSQVINDKTASVSPRERVTKLSVCRICLEENVRLQVVAHKSLQEVYEKLTDIPFVTEDNRPMLACFICYAKLKQCCQFQRQCLQAEELFAQMMNEDYEPNAAMYRSQFKLFREFFRTQTETISIVDESRVEKDAIKVEVPAVTETQFEVELVRVKEEPLSDESDKQEDSNQELEDNPPQHSESNSEDDLPLMVMKFEEEERSAKQTTSSSVAKNPELGIRKAKQEDITPAQHENNGLSDSKIIQTNKTCTSESVKTKEPIFNMNPNVNKCIVEDTTETLNRQDFIQVTNHATTAIDTNGRNYLYENYLMYKMWNNEGTNDNIINRRQNVCTKEKPYKCEICEKRFTQKNNLKAHARIHTGIKPYKCDICLKSFTQLNNLNTHIRLHTGDEPYKCDICSKKFNKKANFNEHLRIHTGEKPYKCEICPQSFIKKDYLTKHILMHTGEKPYECNVCQKSFSLLDSLKKHIRTHTGERPYKCDICLISFARKDNLNEHVLKHTGERPFKCEICPKSFTRKESLRQHICLHTGERSYKCYICLQGFIKKDNLYKHLDKHIVGKPY